LRIAARMKPIFLLAAAVLLGAGCDSDPAGPTTAGIAGSYAATTFTTTSGGATTDQLAQGASFVIQLTENGTTTGHLTVPATSSSPALDADLAGTWTLNGTVIDFDQPADTFVRNMSFIVQGTTLVGDQSFAGTQVHVVLSKQ
jgi:hypothetical protein